MALSDLDRKLLADCLSRKPGAWENFVDRYTGLFVHVIDHAASSRSIRLSAEDRDDLCAEIALTLIRDDFAVLRRFRGNSSLATYLTVVARRVVLREMTRTKTAARLTELAPGNGLEKGGLENGGSANGHSAPEQRISDRDEVQRLIDLLEPSEAQVVRLYHLEGKSYQEISTTVGMPENSVGPVLSRARAKMRKQASDAPTR